MWAVLDVGVAKYQGADSLIVDSALVGARLANAVLGDVHAAAYARNVKRKEPEMKPVLSIEDRVKQRRRRCKALSITLGKKKRSGEKQWPSLKHTFETRTK